MKKTQSRKHVAPLILTTLLLVNASIAAVAGDAVQAIHQARISGGLVAQVGSSGLELKELGERFHVRLLLPDTASVEKAQAAIDRAGLQGRFTVAAWDGGRLPFADRVLNALVLAEDGLVSEEEAGRVLAPGGVLISPEGATTVPWPDSIDEWTHYLYDAGGNAVSRDREVASPRSFRWNAPPRHLRSHNYSSSFTGLVTAGGRVFHILDEGTFLFEHGGATPRFSLVARDAFNGALLWKKELEGYGQPFYEDVAGQAVRDFIWRTPLSMNRRLVAAGERVHAALNYRDSALSILDAATGKVLRELDLGGVDEIIADGDLVICRVRPQIPMPTEEMKGENAWAAQQKLKKEGYENPKQELQARVFDRLRGADNEDIVAVDAAGGDVLWRHHAGRVAVQSLAMAEGKVVYHDYEKLVALDARTGEPVWKYACPAERRGMIRNLLGNLLIEDGKVLWTSSNTGGGVCLNLSDGEELWTHDSMGTTGGFAFPTAQRVINGVIYKDMLRSWNTLMLADASQAPIPDIGQMQTRGHHIRCFPGKATERFLITPHRGAEFIDLSGEGEHMVNDWLRGACSLGNMPANGLFYVTPDPCSCYAGARIYGFSALAPEEPAGLTDAPAPDARERLVKGPAYDRRFDAGKPAGWFAHRADSQRTARATGVLSDALTPTWTVEIGGELTQATIAAGRTYLARKDSYELHCLDLADGDMLWRRAFPAALDGPPTIVGNRLYLGCRDGRVHCLSADDGERVWSFLAAPLVRLTLSEDRLESLWPVSSSVLYHKGLIYALAGRCSYLDGGIRLYALDPATGAVRHTALLEGPWPDEETLRNPVVTERDRRQVLNSGDRSKLEQINRAISDQYATGYHLYGGEADLLVTDGEDLYLTQNKFDPELNRIHLKRDWISGYTPMGGYHMMADSGFLDETMYHRTFMVWDDAWPSYGTGPGSAARGGTVVAVGEGRAYAAQHFQGGGYARHVPGSGNVVVAEELDTENLAGGIYNEKFDRKGGLGDKQFERVSDPLWEAQTPVILRSILVAPDGRGNELVFTAGIVEGTSVEEWDKSTYFIGPGKLQVHSGETGELRAEYDLPACPVFDGMSAANGKLLIPMVNGQVICLQSD